MSAAIRYASEIQCNVREVLFHLKSRGGKAPSVWIEAEANRLKGQRYADVLNIVFESIGKHAPYQKIAGLDASEQASMVVQSQASNADLITEIAVLRAEKGLK